MELPFVEHVAHVGLLVLLAICHEIKPVFDDLSKFDEAPPSIEHLRLQVVISAIPLLPATD